MRSVKKKKKPVVKKKTPKEKIVDWSNPNGDAEFKL